MDFKLTLHTFSLPPGELLQDCLRLISDQDSLLLVGDGVYAAVLGNNSLDRLKSLDCNIYALEEDCDLAGVTSKIAPEVEVVDYSYFVILSEQHEKHIPWD